MIGLEIINPNQTEHPDGSYPADGEAVERIQQACFKQGLVIEKGGRMSSVLRFLALFLIITDSELKQVFQKFQAAL